MQEMQPRRVCDTIDAARQGRPWPPLPVLHAAAVLRPRGLIPLSLWSELWALLLPEQLLLLANAKAALPLRILSLLCVVGAAWTASAAARTEHGRCARIRRWARGATWL